MLILLGKLRRCWSSAVTAAVARPLGRQVSGGHFVYESLERDRVISQAQIGCAYWTRAVGADDL